MGEKEKMAKKIENHSTAIRPYAKFDTGLLPP